MHLDREHIIATALVAAILVPYGVYAVTGDAPFLPDARGMGVVGLVLGGLAWAILGAGAFGPRRVGLAGAALALVLGVAAAALETGTAAAVLIGMFVAVVVALWALAMARHTGHVGPAARPGGGMAPRPT